MEDGGKERTDGRDGRDGKARRIEGRREGLTFYKIDLLLLHNNFIGVDPGCQGKS
jgi:hypothetical protein